MSCFRCTASEPLIKWPRSMTTPPGWYPDPGHTGHGPALERWWDGSAWTDYTREPQGVVASRIPPVQSGFGPPDPLLPLMPPVPPSAAKEDIAHNAEDSYGKDP
jgi:hypothetical protein